MSSFKFVIILSVLAAGLGDVRAVSSEEKEKIHGASLPHLEACSAELGVSLDELIKAKKSGVLGTLDPCVMGCVYKKGGVIDDKGLFDVEKAEEFPKKYLSDEAEQKKVIEIIASCKKVNERDVSDGEKGCERAVLLFECFRPLKDMIQN